MGSSIMDRKINISLLCLGLFQIISGKPVTSKPQLTNSGIAIQVLEGDSVTFPCRTSNLEDFVVLWRKGARVLFAGPIRVKRDERLSLSENDLVLKEIVAEDEGKYSCQVETGEDDPPSIVHKLEVLQRPVIKAQPENGFLVVKEGTSITLQCQAGGNPQPKIIWTRNGQLLGEAERLKVKKLSPEGAGDYLCTADNGIGEPVEFKFTVEVFYAPKVEVVYQSLEPGKIILTCDVKSEPESRVAWYHNGAHLNPSLGIYMGNQESLYNLVVEGDVREVVGEYKCRAENRLGAESKSCKSVESQVSIWKRFRILDGTHTESVGRQTVLYLLSRSVLSTGCFRTNSWEIRMLIGTQKKWQLLVHSLIMTCRTCGLTQSMKFLSQQ